MFIVTAQKGKTTLVYDGRKFIAKGKPKQFRSFREAINCGRALLAEYPVLDTYRVSAREYGVPRGQSQEIKNAARLLKNFSGHDASEAITVNDKGFKTGMVVGPLLAVGYETVKDGETLAFMHEFKKSSRPLLAASHDGKQLKIVGGRFQFTERGIVDR